MAIRTCLMMTAMVLTNTCLAGDDLGDLKDLIREHARAKTFREKGEILDQFQAKLKADPKRFYRELAKYGRVTPETEEWREFFPPQIIKELQIPGIDVLKNVQIILEGDDESLKKVAREWISLGLDLDGGGIDQMRSIVATRPNPEKYLDMIEFMFTIDADKALQTLASMETGNDIDEQRRLLKPIALKKIYQGQKQLGLPSDDSKKKFVSELMRSMDDKRWWVRRYVASVLSFDPQLGIPDLFQKVRDDKNEYVRRWAAKN